MNDYQTKGWQVFAPEPLTCAWADAARLDGVRALKDPALAEWYQCENTWFVGLDALDNDACGRVAGSGPLQGAAVDFIQNHVCDWPALHKGQLSGVFPGYPRARDGETDAGFRYRLNRDAAHVDGVMGEGTPKRRFVREPHSFILGIPLTHADPKAAPLVVWEGSHKVMLKAFQDVFSQQVQSALSDVDVTDAYQAARKTVFETCPRVVVHAPPGAAILVHRMALHGVAPWAEGAKADPLGRLIAYFRPQMPGGVAAWAELARPNGPA